MLLRGTTSKNKSEICEDIENMGARYQTNTGREISSYGMQVLKGDVNNAVKILGD